MQQRCRQDPFVATVRIRCCRKRPSTAKLHESWSKLHDLNTSNTRACEQHKIPGVMPKHGSSSLGGRIVFPASGLLLCLNLTMLRFLLQFLYLPVSVLALDDSLLSSSFPSFFLFKGIVLLGHLFMFLFSTVPCFLPSSQRRAMRPIRKEAVNRIEVPQTKNNPSQAASTNTKRQTKSNPTTLQVSTSEDTQWIVTPNGEPPSSKGNHDASLPAALSGLWASVGSPSSPIRSPERQREKPPNTTDYGSRFSKVCTYQSKRVTRKGPNLGPRRATVR